MFLSSDKYCLRIIFQHRRFGALEPRQHEATQCFGQPCTPQARTAQRYPVRRPTPQLDPRRAGTPPGSVCRRLPQARRLPPQPTAVTPHAARPAGGSGGARVPVAGLHPPAERPQSRRVAPHGGKDAQGEGQRRRASRGGRSRAAAPSRPGRAGEWQTAQRRRSPLSRRPEEEERPPSPRPALLPPSRRPRAALTRKRAPRSRSSWRRRARSGSGAGGAAAAATALSPPPRRSGARHCRRQPLRLRSPGGSRRRAVGRGSLASNRRPAPR